MEKNTAATDFHSLMAKTQQGSGSTIPPPPTDSQVNISTPPAGGSKTPPASTGPLQRTVVGFRTRQANSEPPSGAPARDTEVERGKAAPTSPGPETETDPLGTGGDNSAQVNATYLEIWKSNDQGSGAMASLQGQGGNTLSQNAILLALIMLLPVNLFAPQYTMWNKNPTTTVQVFAVTMKILMPDLYTQIMRCTAVTGQECLNALKEATAATFGAFGAQVHCAFIYALMITIWATDADSPHREVLQECLMQYVMSGHSQLADVKATCSDPHTSMMSSADLQSKFLVTDIATTEGYLRLSYMANMSSFAAHWQFCGSVHVQ